MQIWTIANGKWCKKRFLAFPTKKPFLEVLTALQRANDAAGRFYLVFSPQEECTIETQAALFLKRTGSMACRFLNLVAAELKQSYANPPYAAIITADLKRNDYRALVTKDELRTAFVFNDGKGINAQLVNTKNLKIAT